MLFTKQIPIRNRDSADDGADDADHPLIGAADKEVFKVRASVVFFVRCSVNRAVFPAGKAMDRQQRGVSKFGRNFGSSSEWDWGSRIP